MNLLELPPAVTFALPPPVPAARARSNGSRRFHPKNEPYAVWRDAAMTLVRNTWGARPPLVGPVEVRAAFIFARPAAKPAKVPTTVWSAGARFRLAAGGADDIDNLVKAVLDAMQVPRKLRSTPGSSGEGYPFRDDGVVASILAEKWVASPTEAARTVVSVRPIHWFP